MISLRPVPRFFQVVNNLKKKKESRSGMSKHRKVESTPFITFGLEQQAHQTFYFLLLLASNSIKPYFEESEKLLARWFSVALIKTNEKFSPWLPPKLKGTDSILCSFCCLSCSGRSCLQTPSNYHDALRTMLSHQGCFEKNYSGT